MRKGAYPIAQGIGNTELNLLLYYGMKEDKVQDMIGKINGF